MAQVVMSAPCLLVALPLPAAALQVLGALLVGREAGSATFNQTEVWVRIAKMKNTLTSSHKEFALHLRVKSHGNAWLVHLKVK
jgi:hypothetical protein